LEETNLREIPQNTFFDGFYIWFNTSKKEEYYATPLYLYKTLRNGEIEDKKFSLELEIPKKKANTKEEALKHPATISIPYAENIGMMLVRLLNADLSSFETAYNTFFYAYGFELLKPYTENYELKNKYNNYDELLKELEMLYKASLKKLVEIQ
jgi:hypothetical protein